MNNFDSDIEDADNVAIAPAPGTIKRGRYQLPHPHTGQPHTWMRTTTFIKKIDDLHAIHEWEKRKVIEGLALREDLYAEALTYGISTDGHDLDTRKVNDLVERCKDAAGGNQGSRVGSALHRFTERHDAGFETGAPSRWLHRVEEYAQTLKEHKLTVVDDLIERIVINMRYGCAGTFDRGFMSHTGGLFLGDLKSQKKIYGYMSPAMQFAMYITSDCMWCPKTLRYVDMPAFNPYTALMLWLPAQGDGCEVHWVDTGEGAKMLKLCAEVYEYQKMSKRKGAMGGLRPAPLSLDVISAYADRLRFAESQKDLAYIWDEARTHGVWCEELEREWVQRHNQLTCRKEPDSIKV